MSTPGGNTHVVTVEGDASGFAQRITADSYTFSADESVAAGGAGTGRDPYQLMLAALGACKSMTAALYARRKQWSLTRVRVQLAHSRVWSQDCESCLTQPVQLDRIECAIEFAGALIDAQRVRLLEIVDRCPVHRTLRSEIDIVTRLA